MRVHQFFFKNFYVTNLIGLAFSGLVLRLYHLDANVIEWPVSSILSIFILSGLLNQLRKSLINWKYVSLFFFSFSGLHWVLSGVFEIVLIRFLRYQESYTFINFEKFLSEHYEYLIDGGLWFLFYLVLFRSIAGRFQLESLNRSIKTLEKRLSKTDLNMLGKEINPHFLFNAMNGIAMKVRLDEKKRAVEMIAALNDLLRLNLYGQPKQLITLSQELELLEKYILIERIRFGEHFTWSMEITEEVNMFKVPRMILQPLVENSFKHGLEQNMENMELQLKAKKIDNHLSIRIFNSTKGQTKINHASSNIGISNIVNRLRQIYQSEFQFKSIVEKNGVSFLLLIPIKK